MFRIDKLKVIYPEQLWLSISEEDKEKAWPQECKYSNDAARWNAFLNHLCLNKFQEWLQADSGSHVVVYPSNEDLPSIWEVVNGTAIQLGKFRLILIPSEARDTEEFCIPQEWIDIPNWAGDYYLATQVNLTDGWLRVWGYTTHKQLKSSATYDNCDRNYYLDEENLIADLNVIWVMQEISHHQVKENLAAIEPLASLSAQEAEKVLEKLSQPSPYSPRLEIPFAQWGALLADNNWRQHLYERRQGLLVAPAVTNVSPKQTLVNLSQWLQNVFEERWQTIESLFSTGEENLAFRFRDRRSENRKSETIQQLTDQIYTCHNEDQRKQAAARLGTIGIRDSNAIAALVHLLSTTSDEETRWTAAESLWIIDPGNPAAGIKRVTDLGIHLAGHAIALMVAILPKSSQKLAILLRVYPMGSQKYLPESLHLTVLDDEGNTFLESQARKADNLIQLKFSGSQKDRFSVKISLNDVQIVENFVI